MTRTARLLVLSLLASTLSSPASAAPIISEFMASNQSTLADSDGSHADWIEIHNPDAQPLNLDGWYLTDNANRRTKWAFPAVTLPAGGYLVVFASEKDRRDPAAPLHTNFALSVEGEYLGLIAPDGVTAVSEFAPAFPAQQRDVSYGIVGAPEAGLVGFQPAATPGAANAGGSGGAGTVLAQVQLASAAGGTETFSSGMPILVVDNRGFGPQEQVDGEIEGTLQVFESEVPSLQTFAGIKVRGSTSADFPKKSYSIELHDETGGNASAPVLGMAKSADWALVGPWQYDPSYLRSAYVYALSNRLGIWAPRTRFTEVFLNQDGTSLSPAHYAGIGVLTERIKIGSGLVNLESLSASDVSGEAVTGGYILKFDPKDDDEFGWQTQRGLPVDDGLTAGTMLVVAAPKAAKLAPEQQDYITGYVQSFEDALHEDREGGWATRRYLEFIERDSWVDYHLLQVLTKNPDGLIRSAYFTKDRGGKLKAGPMWDFDRAMGSVDPRSDRFDEWNEPTQASPLWEIGWWGVLAQDPDFIQAWIDRWQTLRRGHLSTEKLAALATTLAAQIDPEAAARDAARWPDNASRFEGGHRGEVGHLIRWLGNRVNWIDHQFVAPPVVVTNGGQRRISAPAGAVIVYTLDGSDPRAAGGARSGNARVASGSLDVPEGATITVRIQVPDAETAAIGSPWSSALVSAPGSGGAGPVSAPSLIALSTRAALDAANPVSVTRFSVSGSTARSYVIRAVGPTLGAMGVAEALVDPVVRVLAADGQEVAGNRDWRTGGDVAALRAASAAAGAFPLSDVAQDAALLVSLAAGSYSVEISSSSGRRGVVLAEVFAVGNASAVPALSVRTVVGADEVLVGGFTLAGSESRRVLVRAVGESAVDASLTLFAGTTLVAENDSWSYAPNASEVASAAAASGLDALPVGSRDAAVLLTLSPGTYTFQATAKGPASGAIVVDIAQQP